jgi:hypothetical protein
MASGAKAAPDVLGVEGRRAIATSLLQNVQQRIFTLEAEQVANGLADDDPAPGFAEKTVAKYRTELREKEARIVDEFGDLLGVEG